MRVSEPPLIVLDTVIAIGGLLGKPEGSDAKVLRYIEVGGVRLATSDAGLRELAQVLERPEITQKLPEPARVFRAALSIGLMGALYHPTRFNWPSLVDEKDWWLLDLAYEAKANYIVSRDKQVIKAGRTLGFKVVTPPELIKILEASNRMS
jgi:putative PIN family toxin of toxin-antitoxin system